MDIAKKLAAEHSKASTMKIVNYIGDDKSRFKVLMDIFLAGEYRLTQRAAWPLSYCAVQHPGLVRPYIGKLVDKLQQPGVHPAIPRNILRLFQEMDIPEKYQAKLLDACFAFLKSEAHPIAVRAFAITVASNICRKYPELKNELRVVLEEIGQAPHSAAIRHRVKVALKAL